MIHYNGLYRVVRKNKSDETTVLYVRNSTSGHVVEVCELGMNLNQLPLKLREASPTPANQLDLLSAVIVWAEDHGLELRRDM